jgi:hypothetical protein
MMDPRRPIIQRLAVQKRLRKTDVTQTAPNQSASSENFSPNNVSEKPASLQQENKSPKQRTEREIHEFK